MCVRIRKVESARTSATWKDKGQGQNVGMGNREQGNSRRDEKQTQRGKGKGFRRPEVEDFVKTRRCSCEKCFRSGSGRAQNRVVSLIITASA
jgi:hypothetical protein